MTMFFHPDLVRTLSDDRRARSERQARESRTRRDYKRKNRHR
jgi:hypothetical protein